MKSKVVLFFVLLFICVLTVLPAAAQDDESELPPWAQVPPWVNSIAYAASMMAVACSALAVAEMSVYPRAFWWLHALAGILLLIAFDSAKLGGPPFWMAAFSVLAVLIILVSVSVSKFTIGKLIRY
jgi:peptidoglycan/LPS O-acetylase OafA/YrhL